VTTSSENVLTLWTKLESMEQEQRFEGSAYPVGMAPFPFRLKGQGFFPGGDGLWRDEEHISEASSGSVGHNGIMFLGNDFGTFASYKKLQGNGYENVPTWRHIKKRALAAQLPIRSLFFTNTILGLREEGTALTKKSWKKMPRFADFCGEFLRFQLQTIQPRLVVVMGPDARESFDAFGKTSFSGSVLYTTHPYADFNFSVERLAADVASLREAWQLASARP
jgi:hypothetical protein